MGMRGSRKTAANMGDLLQDRYRVRIIYHYQGWILRKGNFHGSIVNINVLD